MCDEMIVCQPQLNDDYFPFTRYKKKNVIKVNFLSQLVKKINLGSHILSQHVEY